MTTKRQFSRAGNSKFAARKLSSTWARFVPDVQAHHCIDSLSTPLKAKIRDQAVRDLQSTSKSANINWSSLVDGFLDIGSTFGDLAYPGVGDAFKLGKTLYEKGHVRDAIFGGRQAAKAVVLPKKVVQEVKREVVREGVRRGARAMVNSVRAPRQIKSSGDSVTFSGCDVINLLTSGTSGTLEGAIMKSIRLNPLTIEALGLKQICAKYEEYSFNSLSFHLVGGAGTDEPGSLIHVFDYDPMDLAWTGTGSENVRVAMTHHGSAVSTLWQGFQAHIDTKSVPNRTFFIDETSAERRLTDVGRFYVVAAQPIAANVTIGTLYCDWTVTLKVRSDDNAGPVGEGMVIQAAACDITHKLPDTSVFTKFGLEPISVDHTLGHVVVPAGNYVVVNECGTAEAKVLSFDGTHIIEYSGTGATDRKEFNHTCYKDVGGDTRDIVSFMWITSPSVLTIKVGQLAATTTATNWSQTVYIMAANKSPFGVSLREFARVSANAAKIEAETKLIAEIQESRQKDIVIVQPQDSAIRAALSNSSSSSSASSVAPNLALKPSYFAMRKS